MSRKRYELFKTINKAIKLHEEHISNPKSATSKSQKKLMNLLMLHRKEMKNAL